MGKLPVGRWVSGKWSVGRQLVGQWSVDTITSLDEFRSGCPYVYASSIPNGFSSVSKTL